MTTERESPVESVESVESAESAPASEPAADDLSMVSLQIDSPVRKEPFQITISSAEPISSLKNYLLGLGPLSQPLTCFSLRLKDATLDPVMLVSEQGIVSGDRLSMVPEPYSLSEVLYHVQQVRQVFGLVDDLAGQFPSVNAGACVLPNFKEEKRRVSKKKAKTPAAAASTDKPDLADDHIIFNSSSTPAVFESLAARSNDIKPTARGLHLSAYNPVSPSRKLQGHLAYLRFVAMDHKVFHITATTKGFQASQSTDTKFDPRARKDSFTDMSLLRLLGSLAPATVNAAEHALNVRAKASPLIHMPAKGSFLNAPWLCNEASIPAEIADFGRTQPALCPGSVVASKDWNEELQTTLELTKFDTDGMPSVRDRLTRERLLVSVAHEFATAAVQGAQDIVEGNLTAFNPNEDPDAQIFLRNNIFYTLASDAVGVFANKGGNDAARIAAAKDLRGVETLFNLDITGASLVLTSIIDYAGRRIVAQAPVPGIFREHDEPKVQYGQTEDDIVHAGADFVPLMEKVADACHLKTHTVGPENVELLTSADTKGMLGADGRRYLIDLYRLTPTDLAFQESAQKDSFKEAYPHQLTVLRSEAVTEWFQDQIRPTLEANDGKATPELVKELLAKHRLNPDAQDASSEDGKAVLEASRIVVDKLIPKYLTDISSGTMTDPIDGVQLTMGLHNRGINLRYLGAVDAAVDAHEQSQRLLNLKSVVQHEAVVRAAKYLVNAAIHSLELVDAPAAIVEIVNRIRSAEKDTVAELEAAVRARFRLQLPSGWTSLLQRPSFLRELSLSVGLQWASSALLVQEPLTTEQLLAIVPKVRYASPRSAVADEALEAGRRSLANGEKEVGRELYGEALVLFERVYGNIHPEVARASNHAALAFHELEDYEQAAELERRAILVGERTLGIDSCEVLVMYVNLAFFERQRGHVDLALQLSKHILDIWESVAFANHPDLGTAYNNVGLMLLQSRRYAECLDWFRRASEVITSVEGPSSVRLALPAFQTAQSQLMLGNPKDAARSMEKAYTLYNTEYGPEHTHTKDSKQWLDYLLGSIVRDTKAAKMPAKPKKSTAEPSLVKTKEVPRVGDRSVNEVLEYIMGDSQPKKNKKKSKKNKKN